MKRPDLCRPKCERSERPPDNQPQPTPPRRTLRSSMNTPIPLASTLARDLVRSMAENPSKRRSDAPRKAGWSRAWTRTSTTGRFDTSAAALPPNYPRKRCRTPGENPRGSLGADRNRASPQTGKSPFQHHARRGEV